MHPLEKEIFNLIQKDQLIASGEKIVIGVSGGPDSMALMHVLASLRQDHNIDLVAVYVDHGLRPNESPVEKELVQGRARALNITFRTTTVDVREEARHRKISKEHSARDLRYAFFSQVAEEEGAEKIAVAHTADDQAEEVVLRLIRGTGRAGLSGMKTIRDGIIIRPFLETSKQSLLSYLNKTNIPFCEDSSNLDTIYLRNQIRLELMPFLSKMNPNIPEVLRQTATVLQDEEIVLHDLTEKAWASVVIVARPVAQEEYSSVTISLVSFLQLAKGIQRRVIEKVFIEMDSQPQWKKIESILSVAKTGETGARLHFSRGLRMKKQRDRLVFSYPQGLTNRRGNLQD
jgi:tRNA(Ile)-lysidine synthase